MEVTALLTMTLVGTLVVMVEPMGIEALPLVVMLENSLLMV